MKDYKEVVDKRYNSEQSQSSVYDNIYSSLNPIGFYIKYKLDKVFCEIFKKLNDVGVDFTNAKILDIGCGTGNLLRFIGELKQGTENLYGLDLSEVRIQKAKGINPNIKYFIDDIVNMKNYNMDFEIITALDVFMHLNTEEQIVKALENVNINLKDNGIFIWYDGYWESHFTPVENADSCGFNPKEMEYYANLAGFEKILETSAFKYLYNQVENSTAYMGNQHPIWLLELMEENSPGLPVNLVMVFKKVDDKKHNKIGDSIEDDKMENMKVQFKNNIQLLINDGKLDNAKELIKEYKKIVIQDVDIYSMDSVIEIMRGNLDNAARIISEGLFIEGNNVDLLYNYAYIEELNGNIKEALKYYKFAYRLADENMKITIKEYIKNLIHNYKLSLSLDHYIKKEIDDRKSKKILIVCNFYSPYLKGYMEKIKEEYNVDFDVITVTLEDELTIKDNGYYKFVKAGIINKIYTYKYIDELNDLLNNMSAYDIIHTHYLQPDYSYIANTLRNKCDVLVATIWGSDFYRTSDEEKEMQKELVNKCDIITFDNEITMDEFIEYYGEYVRGKCTISRFGLTALEYIDKLDYLNKNDIKGQLDIPEQSIVVQCGYNAKSAHNHIYMIDSILSVKEKLPENMFYIFPMTYGKEESYMKQVKDKLESSKLNYKIMEDFMQFEDVAKLTKCTDIMIHLQTTDTLSATMQEHLYNGNITITGSWLPYKPFKDIGTYFIEVPYIDNLGKNLLSVVNNFEEEKNKSIINKRIIREFSSWEATSQQWIRNYESSMKKLAIKNSRKKVLVIAYFFPPLGGAGVQRTLKYVKYLREFGWEPIVVTVGNSSYFAKDSTLLQDIPEGIKIVRIDELLAAELNDEFINKLINFYLPIINNDELINDYLKRLNEGGENIENLVFIPDYYSAWGYKVSSCIEKIIDFDSIDLIYSTSSPQCDHMIGYNLKRKYGIPWVADFRDEWTNNPYVEYDKDSLKFKIERNIESNILNLADKVVTVTSVSANNYLNIFNLQDINVEIITNGYDEEDFIGVNLYEKVTNKFSIIHNGLFYSVRTPITFLTAIKNLINKGLLNKNEIQIYFTRTSKDDYLNKYIFDNNLSEFTECLDYLTHKNSLELCSKSNLLLLVIGEGEKCKGVFTGKIFEYLRLAKPILALAPKGGVVDQLIQETNSGKTVEYGDVNAIEKSILYYYENWKTGNYSENTISKKTKRYSRKNLTRKLAEVFDTLVVGKDNITAIIEKVEREIRLGNFELSEEIIKKNLLIEFNNYHLLYNLGKVYLKMERYNESLGIFNIVNRICDENEVTSDINNKITYIKSKLKISENVTPVKEKEEIEIITNKLQGESFEYKIMKMIRHTNIDTLITGLSYFDVGLIEETFDLKTVNMALSGQDLHYDYLVFKYLLENYKSFSNLKNIIIGLSYYSFNYDLSKTDSKIYIHRYINYIKKEQNNDESLKLINDIYLRKFSIYDDVEQRESKSLLNFNDLNENYKEYLLEEAKKQSNMSYPNTVKENIEYLIKMLDIAKQKGIKPILLVAPVTADYSDLFIDSDLKKEFYLLIKKLSKQYNFVFCDYFNHENFSREDFYDYSHLNKKGAIKLSKIINSKIEK